MTSKYVTPITIQKTFDISRQTLVRWEKEEKITAVRMPNSKKRLYNFEQIKQFLGANDIKEQEEERKEICYARVSSDHQKEDLQRQINYLKQQCPDAEIISDIGSGLNFNRKGFNSILEKAYKGNIKQITITHKDRLCRYGYEMVEWLFTKTNTKLVVLSQTNESDNEQSSITREQELAQDLLSVVNVFVARNNGFRAAENRRKRKRADQTNQMEQEEEKNNNLTNI